MLLSELGAFLLEGGLDPQTAGLAGPRMWPDCLGWGRLSVARQEGCPLWAISPTVLMTVWILPGEEGRVAQAKPGQLLPAHCRMRASAFAELASSLCNIAAIGGERSFVLKQGRAWWRARQRPMQPSTGGVRNPRPLSPMSWTPLSWPLHMRCPLVGKCFPLPNHASSTSCYDDLPPPLHCTLTEVSYSSWWPQYWALYWHTQIFHERSENKCMHVRFPLLHLSACASSPLASYTLEHPSHLSWVPHPWQSFSHLPDETGSPGRLCWDSSYFPFVCASVLSCVWLWPHGL